jgi:hypothetical protein
MTYGEYHVHPVMISRTMALSMGRVNRTKASHFFRGRCELSAGEQVRTMFAGSKAPSSRLSRSFSVGPAFGSAMNPMFAPACVSPAQVLHSVANCPTDTSPEFLSSLNIAGSDGVTGMSGCFFFLVFTFLEQCWRTTFLQFSLLWKLAQLVIRFICGDLVS